jgi:hypothetical protein
MFEPERLDPAHRNACYILLAIGAGVLALGLYMGFVKHANSPVVFVSLGITTVVFGTVLFVLLKPHAFAFLSPAAAVPQPKAEPKLEANTEPQFEAKDAPSPSSNNVRSPSSKARPRPEDGTQPRVQVNSQIGRGTKSEPQDEASSGVVTPLDMTLGDILLAALRKDPLGAGRIFARAVVQVDVPIAAAKAGEPKTELQPELPDPVDMSPARRGPNQPASP